MQRPASLDKVEGIGNLEAAFGMSAGEITFLIADAGDDVIGLAGGLAAFNPLPFSAFERHDGAALIVIGTCREAYPVEKTLMVEIEDRDSAL